MRQPTALFESQLPLPLVARGKVRDIYAVDTDHWLIVTTDRLSAFDVVFPNPIPDKGKILTRMSNFWFSFFHKRIGNHLCDIPLEQVLKNPDLERMQDRAVVVRKMRALPFEAIVRGYLAGSGWKDYQNNQTVCGISLPSGLSLAEKLPKAIFTPSTKADMGEHDENISFEQAANSIGSDLAQQLSDVSVAIYTEAASYALERGIIIADTKLEFGLDNDDQLVLIDEVLTPDSSRFWPVKEYRVGRHPPSFDKQYVRNYLESIHWNKSPPAPELPAEVVSNTTDKYREALKILTK
jgi:phosphoribosylaminoimidazole-succinocarboxamide synthase